jgi:hypothetical protein
MNITAVLSVAGHSGQEGAGERDFAVMAEQQVVTVALQIDKAQAGIDL